MRVDVPENPVFRAMAVGPKVNVIPVVAGGDTVADNETLPVKPRLPTVIVEVAELPAIKRAGVAAPTTSVKSAVTVAVTVAVCD